ncbi:type IV secretion system DNA-binding domain-containing protein [Saccharopolyspora sp. NPDC049357]|uniref:type IV secretion system DNA-binding domain-containing protein n=1 Tax=Saccharopolyspora sp. NPDC049357 TaxID=3154507 RepID=UPI0034250323
MSLRAFPNLWGPVELLEDGIAHYLQDPETAIRPLLHRPLLLASMLAGLVAAIVLRLSLRAYRRNRLNHNAKVVTIQSPPTVDAAGGAALWSHLVGLLRPAWKRALLGQPHLACEYVITRDGITIQIWVPGTIPPGLIERAVEAAWPGARTHTQPATSPIPEPDDEHTLVVGGELRLARPETLPIKTDFDTDPLRAILAAPSGLGPGEYVCVQVLARPAAGRRLTGAPHLRGFLFDLLTPGTTRSPQTKSTRGHGDTHTRLERSARDRVSVTKQRGSQYETRLRYAASTVLTRPVDPEQQRRARRVLRGRAHTLATCFAAYTDHNRYWRHRLNRPAPALRHRGFGRGDLLSVPEIAALAHLPTDEAIPGLHRAGARALTPPPEVAAPGPEVKPLGTTDTGATRRVGLRAADARQHLHLMGATGSGKSTLLAQMILADAEAERGCLVIDPKGDLVTDVLSRLPKTAANRLVLFDADARSRPPCLNPLDGEAVDVTVDNLVSVFRRVYSAFWGPRTDDVFRAACLTLRTQGGITTLADVPRLLAEPAFRDRVTAGVTDPVLRGFWDWYAELTEASRAQVIAPLMNKLRSFLLRPFVRDALTAGASTADMNAVLDGGICLVRIPKGSLGDETSRLFGSLAVARAWQATTARAATPQRERRDASMYIDECHNFLNLPYPLEDMLAEARGFRVSMTLAHQHLGQLPRDLREGISTNARNKVLFAASPEDARALAQHTHPHLTDHDLAHLDAYHAAARLVVHGQQSRPFTLVTDPLPAAIPGRSRALRRQTATRTRPGAEPPAASTGTSQPPRASTDPRLHQ